MDEWKSVAVIGAGPVGSLAALYFARHVARVDLYDLRPDPRQVDEATVASKSINLALSDRGICALEAVNTELRDEILSTAIPMYGRMIHTSGGLQISQLYDVHGRHINSVDRSWLNERILTEAERQPNIHVHFGHKLTACDLRKQEMTFTVAHRSDTGMVTKSADLIVGTDGAHSVVRHSMMRTSRLNFRQRYIDCDWKELHLPPIRKSNNTTDWALDLNRLHIWPRQTYMLIALPNQDKSFTCTLFMSPSMLGDIRSESDLLSFFNKQFPDFVPLIGADELVRQFFSNPQSSLMSILCSPHVYSDKAILLGDAAHAMVPFYGQGMNAGFEDIRVLFEQFLLSPKYYHSLKARLTAYSSTRVIDAHSITHLALSNYTEMSSSVISRRYLYRKQIEEMLYKHFQWLGIVPLYTLVTFSPRVRYSQAQQRYKFQGRLFNGATAALALIIIGISLRRLSRAL